MVWKNLVRRKGRTILTILGVSIGIAIIIGLGSLAQGLQAGYSSMLSGSNADLILNEPDAYDLSMSSIDEQVGDEIQAMPEVDAVSGMLQGLVQAEGNPYFFVFGYPEGSFTLDRYNIIEGNALYSPEATRERGNPMILGSAAAEAMNKSIGDIVRLGESSFRVVGIYDSGQAFEDGGAVIRMQDAQEMLGMQHQVSAFYIQIDDKADVTRLKERIARQYSDLSLSTAEDLGERNQLADSVQGMVWGVAALAILIGGVSTMNSQLMSVMERTREIGVLRAVGWRRWRVMLMVLGESLAVSVAPPRAPPPLSGPRPASSQTCSSRRLWSSFCWGWSAVCTRLTALPSFNPSRPCATRAAAAAAMGDGCRWAAWRSATCGGASRAPS
jgi:putative ABC transport system permease protein